MSDEAILDGFRHLEAYMTELFERTEHRFERMERRLDRVEVKLIDLEQTVETGFAAVNVHLSQLDKRVTSMEAKIHE